MMKLFLCATVFLLCLPAIIFSSSKQDKVGTIVSMRCVFTSWGVLIGARQTPQSFLKRPKELSDSLITYNKGYLSRLQAQMQQLKKAPDTVHIDVRTVCLIETDRGTIDTLSFGDFSHCQYNGQYYYLSWDLFQTIMQKLPPDEDITWWLQDDPSLKERMIENGKK